MQTFLCEATQITYVQFKQSIIRDSEQVKSTQLAYIILLGEPLSDNKMSWAPSGQHATKLGGPLFYIRRSYDKS